MLSKQQEEGILAILESTRAALSEAPINAPHDYPSLKNRIIQLELSQSLNLLSEMVTHKVDVEASFKALCAKRSSIIEGTCLSYQELPEGACNRLYWDIATTLFEPKTEGDMLAILMPSARVCLEIDYQNIDPSQKMSSKNLAILITENSVKSGLTEAPQLKRLGELIVLGSSVIDLRLIALFDFSLHRMFFKAINEKNPALAGRLYQHNLATRTLRDELKGLEGSGKTPKEALSIFITELLRSGTRMTGKELASPAAQIALVSFSEYLAALPDDVKASLLALKAGTGLSLADIMDSLVRKADCVELAAQGLKDIKDNPVNQEFLKTYPGLSKKYSAELENSYGPKHPLPLESMDAFTNFPNQYLKETLSSVTLNNAQSYLSLLLSFLPDFYDQLIQSIAIDAKLSLPIELGEMIYEGALNEEREMLFFDALINHQDRFDTMNLIDFFIAANAGPALTRYFKSLSDENQILVRQHTDEEGNTLFHRAAKRPLALQALIDLSLSSPPTILQALQKKNSHKESVLHLAAEDARCLQICLEHYPPESTKKAIEMKDDSKKTVLHHAAENFDSVKTLLELYIPDSKDEKKLLIKKNNIGETVLHLAAAHPRVLAYILNRAQSSQMALIKKTNVNGETLLHLAFDSPETIRTVLEVVPEKDRLSIMSAKSKFGSTVLHMLSENPQALQTALRLLPQESRLQLINEPNQSSYSVIQLAVVVDETIIAVESVSAILQSLPEDSRLAVILKKNGSGDNTFHLAAHAPAILKKILELIPETSYETLVQTKNGVGDTPLKIIIDNPDALRAILRALKPEARLRVITSAGEDEDNVLERAVEFPESLSAILELLTQEDRLTSLNHAAIISCVVEEPKSLRIIFECLPVPMRVELLEAQTTILYNPQNPPDSLYLVGNCTLENFCYFLLNNLYQYSSDDLLKRMLSSIDLTAKPFRDTLHDIAESHLRRGPNLFTEKRRRMDVDTNQLCQIMASDTFVSEDSKLNELIQKLLEINQNFSGPQFQG